MMRLGLERGKTRLVPHEKEWEGEAERIIGILWRIIPEARDIQHIGSTAVKTIEAKPIIDIAVALDDPASAKTHIEEMARCCMTYRGSDVPGQFLFVIGDGDIRTHHIHVVRWRSEAWENYIAFRDYLNSHPDKAAEYERLKKRLAVSFPDNRKAYTEGKAGFIRSLLTEARDC